MARDYTDSVQYRRRTNSTQSWPETWTEVTSDGTSPLTFSPALATGYEYEFRVVRTRGGQSALSAANTNDQTYLSNTVNLDLGGTISSTGSFTLTGVTGGGSDVTFTRTKGADSLKLAFATANWSWVGISYGSPLDYFSCTNTNSTPPASQTDGTNTYTTDATKIVRVDNKNVTVKLSSTVTFSVKIVFQGNSSGSITVNGL